jgi:hypothetical protein
MGLAWNRSHVRSSIMVNVLGCRARFGRMQAVKPVRFFRRPPTSYGRFRQGLNAACRHYLAFAPNHRNLEKTIAWEAVRWATDPKAHHVGHDRSRSLEAMAFLAIRATIRHQYTDYDQELNDQWALYHVKPPHSKIRLTAERRVDEFLAQHRLSACI